MTSLNLEQLLRIIGELEVRRNVAESEAAALRQALEEMRSKETRKKEA